MLAVLTCPSCAADSTLEMPVDRCLFFHECEFCGLMMKPLPGDCCVFCSYGDRPCPPVAEAGGGC